MANTFYVSRQIFNLIAGRHFDDRKQENGEVAYFVDGKETFRRAAGNHNLHHGLYKITTTAMPYKVEPVEGTEPLPKFSLDAHDRRVWPSFDVDLDPGKAGFILRSKHVTFRFQ